MGDKFSPGTVGALAKRAAYICSNPKCRRMTIGPAKDDGNSIIAGVASHIRAGSEGGPRYDKNQSVSERKSIKNGIWLCGTCSYMIDKNNGNDYTVQELEDWKKLHEGMIKAALEGEKRIVFSMLIKYEEDLDYIRDVIDVLGYKGALFENYDIENPYYVLSSIESLRRDLFIIQRSVKGDSKLKVIIESMVKACRYYMNHTSVENDHIRMNTGLGAFRKMIGLNLKELINEYELEIINDGLLSIIPSVVVMDKDD